MLISDVSLRRPVFATVIMLALVTLGMFSYRRLAVDLYPDVEIPVLSIITRYPGAPPETVEREVSKRIEEAVNPISGVKHVNSTSKENVSLIIVQFHLETDINDVIQEARAKVNAIRGDLPEDIEDPVIQKLDFQAEPVISLSVRSDVMDPVALSTLVEKRVKQRLENLPGVGRVDMVGLSRREVNVIVDQKRMESLGMGVDELINGLRSENVNTPLGSLKCGVAEYPLRISGKPGQVSGFAEMVIGAKNGRPVLLSEVAEVRDGMEEQRSLALVDRVPAVALNVLKQSGANTVAVVDAVKKVVEKLDSELPGTVHLSMVRDGSKFIRDSVDDVEHTLIIGGLLTIFIVFCFLNSWRSTVITGITLPISVISSFTIMQALGMTLNVMTLMALSLAIGLLIDDAIVVRENIVRHLEKGKSHMDAAREGTNEIGLAVMATTFSIVAVFIPVAYMKGIVGRFFFSFGITVTFAVLVSLLVSFTMDPMLSSRWFDPDIHRKPGTGNLFYRMLDHFNAAFDRLGAFYRKALASALRHRLAVVAATLAAFAGGIMLFGMVPKSFFTQTDEAEFQIKFTTAPYASMAETQSRLDAVLTALHSIPEVTRTYATIGAGEQGTVRDGFVYVKLTEKNTRERKQFEIETEVREKLSDVPGIESSIGLVSAVDSRKPIMVGIRGPEIDTLKEYAARLKKEVAGLPGITDLAVTLEQQTPEIRMRVDRERALATGVSTSSLVRAVAALVGGLAVTTYEDEEGDAVNLRVRLPETEREDPAQVGNLRMSVPRRDGTVSLIPLSELVSYENRPTPSEITREDLNRQVYLSASPAGNTALGTAVDAIKEKVEGLNLAPGYSVVYRGQVEDMEESFLFIFESLILAIIFVYLILAAQFESFVDPFSIMFSLPLSIVGMAGMLYLTGDSINIMSLIGLIMLMGLVTKNAILLVDFAKQRRGRGEERSQALVEAGAIRLRPIMMTTLAMIFGMLPLALAIGPGAEMRAPMARAVVGGLITSTLLTLVVVPVVYTLLDDAVAFLKRIAPRKKLPAKLKDHAQP